MIDRDNAPTRRDDTGAVVCPWCGTPDQSGERCNACEEILVDRRQGETIEGRYRVDSLLGVGGFGRVYRGTHLSLGEPVAIKFLLQEWSARAEVRARFKREAVVLARLRHPGIVSVYDYGEYRNELYMVMELVRGEGLDKHVVVNGHAMEIPRAVGLIRQLLEVLMVSHEEGIVHRDLKPENVMLVRNIDQEERIKVLDFGLALMTEAESAARLTASQAVHGTPVYMSPEQCRGRDVGTPTDIYAVGVMLYELLTGMAPFPSGSNADIMVKQLFVQPPAMITHGAKRAIPAALEALTLRALSKNAADRPSAREFRDQLDSAMRGDDDVSRAEKAASQRVDVSFLSREERAAALPSVSEQPTMQSTMVAVPQSPVEAPRIVLWGLEPDNRDRLVDALSVNGITAVAISDAKTVPLEVAGHAVKAVVVEAHEAIDKLNALRSVPITRKLPVLVIELPSAEHAPALIRAGANDVAALSATSESICKQLWRLIRRGR